MAGRREVSFWECASETLNRMRDSGVLCTVVDHGGRQNVLTLGWGQIGHFYHSKSSTPSTSPRCWRRTHTPARSNPP
jgi:hypothetical protein